MSQVDADGGALEIELRPDNRAYRTLRMRKADGEIRVVAEMLEVLG